MHLYFKNPFGHYQTQKLVMILNSCDIELNSGMDGFLVDDALREPKS